MKITEERKLTTTELVKTTKIIGKIEENDNDRIVIDNMVKPNSFYSLSVHGKFTIFIWLFFSGFLN